MTRMAPAAGLGVYVSVRLLPQPRPEGACSRGSESALRRQDPTKIAPSAASPPTPDPLVAPGWQSLATSTRCGPGLTVALRPHTEISVPTELAPMTRPVAGTAAPST